MYAILAEHHSDANTLKVIVGRLAGDRSLRIKPKGFDGSGRLLRKGAKALETLAELRYTRFVICHDADGPDPKRAYDKVMDGVVRPSRLEEQSCIVVPVQELEAWILADIEAVTKIWTSWKPTKPITSPEKIVSPKEELERLSRDSRGRRRYAHAADNPRIAEHLDLAKLSKKCRSFRPLETFVAQGPRT